MKRKHYSAAFKAQIVQDVLKENKTISQIAAEQGIHPTVIAAWKDIALKGLPGLFENGHSELAVQKAAHEKQVNELYTEIGRLTTRLNWLKKKAGIDE